MGPVAPGLRGQRRAAVPQLGDPPPAELSGRQSATAPFGLLRIGRCHTAQHVGQQAIAHRPLFEGVDLDRHVVGYPIHIPRQGVVQGSEEAFDGMIEEGSEIGQCHVGDIGGG
ncbi:Uncharacterised protein [Mycobacteroides abscessus subsp. abscessus]|nr:Uncharacterised protein [Mycobacteroides abscessus subsp. abscessus]